MTKEVDRLSNYSVVLMGFFQTMGQRERNRAAFASCSMYIGLRSSGSLPFDAHLRVVDRCGLNSHSDSSANPLLSLSLSLFLCSVCILFR